jgi:hypothetical protein
MKLDRILRVLTSFVANLNEIELHMFVGEQQKRNYKLMLGWMVTSLDGIAR